MTSRQEAKLNMYHAVITHCDANAGIIAGVTAFTSSLATFKLKVTGIDDTAQLEAEIISGIATDKKVLRTTLSQQAADIAALVFAYAKSTSNNTLAEAVDYSKSELGGLRDDELAPAAQNIHDAANTNLVALAPYGITAPTLTAFQTMITSYTDAVPKPRNAAAQKKTYSATLVTLFEEADAILKDQMDKIVVQFKTSHPDFYSTYKNNRVILDAPVSNSQAAGLIIDASTNDPVFGVTVTVDGQPYSGNSGPTGEYGVKIPAPGVYTLIFTKTGYQPLQQTNVIISLGQTTTKNVELTPAP